MIILASFLAIIIVTNRNTQSDSNNSIKAQETQKLSTYETHTYFVKKYPTKYFDEGQEEIRNEIFYGELEELVVLVQAEAGNQDELGKRYVADCVLNRVDSKDFPDTIHDVIYQINPVQFATTVDGAIEKAEYTVSEEIFQIVLEEYEHRQNYEMVYFKTDDYHECGTPMFKHGAHYFSKL